MADETPGGSNPYRAAWPRRQDVAPPIRLAGVGTVVVDERGVVRFTPETPTPEPPPVVVPAAPPMRTLPELRRALDRLLKMRDPRQQAAAFHRWLPAYDAPHPAPLRVAVELADLWTPGRNRKRTAEETKTALTWARSWGTFDSSPMWRVYEAVCGDPDAPPAIRKRRGDLENPWRTQLPWSVLEPVAALRWMRGARPEAESLARLPKAHDTARRIFEHLRDAGEILTALQESAPPDTGNADGTPVDSPRHYPHLREHLDFGAEEAWAWYEALDRLLSDMQQRRITHKLKRPQAFAPVLRIARGVGVRVGRALGRRYADEVLDRTAAIIAPLYDIRFSREQLKSAIQNASPTD